MGSYDKVVNVAKRQYLDPVQFGEPFTWRWVPGGYHAIATAMLVCGPRRPVSTGELLGSWYGDPVELVGDGEPPDRHGIRTATSEEPHRNLYAMAAAEFEDISTRAILMLINLREEAAERLAEQAASNPYEGLTLLTNLGNILRRDEFRREIDTPEVLERAFARHVGPDWEVRYAALVSEAKRRGDS